MRQWTRWLAGAAALAIAGLAGAADPPAHFSTSLPIVRTQFERYGFLEIGYPDPSKPRELIHIEPRGRRWRIELTVPKGSKPSVLAPGLKADGWEILEDDPIVVARRRDGEQAWAKSSIGGIVEVLEVTTPRRLTLTPPGAAPEPLAKDEDAPYFSPMPGLRRVAWQLDTERGCDVRNNVIRGLDYAGPPAVQLKYSGASEELTGLELQESYVDALGRAGWQVLATGRGNNTVAHFGRDGRDLWLRFSPAPGALGVCIADVGAAAANTALKRAIDEVGHVAIYGIYFDLDKATLRPEAEATLQQIRALLVAAPKLALEIQGHTDSQGADAHNQKLSEERAASVKAWLVAHQIDGARLSTIGYGESKPIAPNTTPEGRQKNRRVELARRSNP